MMRIATLTLALAACTTTTSVQLDVIYDDGWSLTELQLSAADKASTIEPAHAITIAVPEDWTDTAHTISLLGMRGGDQWARGAVSITPRHGAIVETSVHLTLLSCATSCVEGANACVAGGLAKCELGADSCLAFGAPTACGSGTRCSDGACVPGDPVVLPSNSQTIGALEQTGITLDIANGYIFDTDADCYAGSALGDCEPVTPLGTPAICVCRADTVTIHDLDVRGTRALALLAWTSVTVQGNVVIEPGAGLGAAYGTDGSAGGSYATAGGNGGAPTYGNAELVPLVGGMTGQGSSGGTGGGALQITADQLVRVEGSINVPGAGASHASCSAMPPDPIGHGGGSGGGLLLEARHVNIVGGAAANGGGGGGGAARFSDGSIGCPYMAPAGSGVVSATVAAAGEGGRLVRCTVDGHTVGYGGTGGAGSIADGGGGNSTPTKSGSDQNCSTTDGSGIAGFAGGGGGGARRIRINTFAGACGCTGILSPTPTYGTAVVD